MIKKANDTELIALGCKAEHVFFFQAWKELTEYRTLDTYQYKSINILNGTKELVHNIDAYLAGNTMSTDNISAMAEELLLIAKRDVVIASRFPTYKNRLLPILSKKLDTMAQFKGLKYNLAYILKELEEKYDNALILTLSEAVNMQSPHQYPLIAQFVSRAVDLGWSVNALYKKVDSLKNETVQQEGIEQFLSKIIGSQSQTYAAIIPFRIKVSPKNGQTRTEARNQVYQQIRQFDISVRTHSEIVECYPEINIEAVPNNQHCLVVSVPAHDVYSASHFAITKLSKVLNTLSFFTTIESWSIKDISVVIYNTEVPYTDSINPSEIYKTYEYLDSSSRVYRRTAKLLSENIDENNLSQKLLSSFSYANLSRVSMALEEKYMNIWIAVESLCRSETHNKIIDSILTLIPNASCLRYIYRLVRNFIEDCSRCEIDFVFSSKTIDMRAQDKENLVSETISIFRDSVLCSELQEKCKCNSLLLHRFTEIKQLLNDEQSFIDKIKNHHITIRWHLSRLYRIRNEIAHSGSLQEISAIRYTEHLYDYLATLVSEMMRFSDSKRTTSQETIFALINDNYREFIDLASVKKPINRAVSLGKLWTAGIIDYL